VSRINYQIAYRCQAEKLLIRLICIAHRIGNKKLAVMDREKI